MAIPALNTLKKEHRVAVIGYGACAHNAPDAETLFQNVLKKKAHYDWDHDVAKYGFSSPIVGRPDVSTATERSPIFASEVDFERGKFAGGNIPAYMTPRLNETNMIATKVMFEASLMIQKILSCNVEDFDSLKEEILELEVGCISATGLGDPKTIATDVRDGLDACRERFEEKYEPFKESIDLCFSTRRQIIELESNPDFSWGKATPEQLELRKQNMEYALEVGKYEVVRQATEAQLKKEGLWFGDNPTLITQKVMGSGQEAFLDVTFGFTKYCIAVTKACASGKVATNLAGKAIRNGEADIIFCVSTEPSMIEARVGFVAQGVLSTAVSNDYVDKDGNPRAGTALPEDSSRPGDVGSAGFQINSGGNVIVLCSYEYAKENELQIFAEWCGGYSNSGGGNGGTITRQSDEGMQTCVIETLDDAGIEIDQISLIQPHNTATSQDEAEYKLFCETGFGKDDLDEQPYWVALKGSVGHMLGNASGVEDVLSIQMLEKQTVLPNMNLKTLQPVIAELWDSTKITTKAVYDACINYILSVSFGFGDGNEGTVWGKGVKDPTTLQDKELYRALYEPVDMNTYFGEGELA